MIVQGDVPVLPAMRGERSLQFGDHRFPQPTNPVGRILPERRGERHRPMHPIGLHTLLGLSFRSFEYQMSTGKRLMRKSVYALTAQRVDAPPARGLQSAALGTIRDQPPSFLSAAAALLSFCDRY